MLLYTVNGDRYIYTHVLHMYTFISTVSYLFVHPYTQIRSVQTRSCWSGGIGFVGFFGLGGNESVLFWLFFIVSIMLENNAIQSVENSKFLCSMQSV